MSPISSGASRGILISGIRNTGIVTSTPPPPIITDGLVLNLDAGNSSSYPGSGTTWTDLSGNGNNGTLVGGVSYTSEYQGGLVFDGVNDYVGLPSINTNSNFSLEFWTMVTSNSNPTLISGVTGTGYLQIRQNSAFVSLVKSYTSELGNFGASSATTLNTNNQVIVTKNGTTFTCYINGQQKGTLTVNQTFSTSAPTLGVNYNNTEFYSGRIYKFAYYNKELTASEVLQNFNALKGRYGL